MIRINELLPRDWTEVWGADLPTSGMGVIYTKPEVSAWVLDLVGYTIESDLPALRLLDPGCGAGAFVLEAVRRLAARVAATGGRWEIDALDTAITGVEIDARVLADTRENARATLVEAGCPGARAGALAGSWFIHTDFLLHDWAGRTFDRIVGNPPYVRLEDLSKKILAAYRDRFETANERADLYIPFFELGLGLLSPGGTLAYLCANRFAKNRYGTALRRLIATRHHVRAYINLEHTQPFEGKVSAYPAVVILDNAPGTPTAVSELTEISENTLSSVTRALTERRDHAGVHHFTDWHTDGGPWILSRHEDLDFKQSLAHLPLLEDSAPGTRVGIGVATGADRVFIRTGKPAGVEDDALLPLIEAGDIRDGTARPSDRWLLNPYRPDGTLRDDSDAPGLMRDLREHEERLRARHCAKKTPERWHRTIDRIWPQWVEMPKLLLPDIQPGGIVAYDSGRFYPHHNVYWIASESWDLRALQTLLRSDFVTRQIRAHSVQMRGGSLRYQTQSLRKLRVPHAKSLSAGLLGKLAELAESEDAAAIRAASAEAFF